MSFNLKVIIKINKINGKERDNKVIKSIKIMEEWDEFGNKVEVIQGNNFAK